MSRPQRVVLDNNLIISRMIFPRGVAASVFDLVYDTSILLTSDQVSRELRRVAERPKFDRYLDLSKRLEFIEQYLEAAKFISITDEVQDCRDPKDDKFLELAFSGRADLILTGDEDLLTLTPWRGISILSPAIYLDSIR